MLQELKFQLSTALLTVLTIAAAIAAALNYQQIHRFRLPDDGVTWGDRTSRRAKPGRRAAGDAERPADRAGIRANDVLKSIQAAPITDTSDVPRSAWPMSARGRKPLMWCGGSAATGVQVDVPATVIVGEAARGIAITWQYLVGVCLSRHRPVYLFPPRQRLQGAAFLCLLSGFVHLFLLPLHRQTERLRSGDLLGQPDRGLARAGSVSAFLPDFPGAARLVPALDGARDLYVPGVVLTLIARGFRAGRADLRRAIRCSTFATRSTAPGWGC